MEQVRNAQGVNLALSTSVGQRLKRTNRVKPIEDASWRDEESLASKGACLGIQSNTTAARNVISRESKFRGALFAFFGDMQEARCEIDW